MGGATHQTPAQGRADRAQRTERARAERRVDAAYRGAGLPAPRLHLWLRSPYEGLIGAAFARGRPWTGDAAEALLAGQVDPPVDDRTWDQIWERAWDQAGEQIADGVWDAWGLGADHEHESGWWAFHDYFGAVYGLAPLGRRHPLMAAARAASWWWPYQRAVVLTERPVRLGRDGRGGTARTAAAVRRDPTRSPSARGRERA